MLVEQLKRNAFALNSTTWKGNYKELLRHTYAIVPIGNAFDIAMHLSNKAFAVFYVALADALMLGF